MLRPMAAFREGNSTLVLLGDVSEAVIVAVENAAEIAGETVHVETQVDRAVAWIDEQSTRPTAIAIWMEPEGAGRQALEVRQHFHLAATPVIGLVRSVRDLDFEEAFATGVDDVSSLDPLRLGRRLRRLEECEAGQVKRREDVVLIADADRNTRLLNGRVFRNAGYQVQFALDAEEALRQSLDPKTLVVLVSAEIDSASAEPLSTIAAREGSRAAWIVHTPPKEMATVRARIGAPAGVKVTVHDAFAAPATLLFVANELLNKPPKDVRGSERVLYGTSVRFRQAGREDDDIGYMYNLSEGGFYVRTYAAPERWDEMWLEFVPPRSDRRVHLEGRVVWVRGHGPGSSASVPPGFGVQLTGGSKGDLERYERGYRAFLEDRGGTMYTSHPEQK
jgi:CheY-like chemotaxis protein/Tfp pilus assembly protein PilZ